MAESNAEIVRRWQTEMNAGPERAAAAVGVYWDADADYYPVRKFPDVRPRHGRADIAEFVEEFWGAYAIVEYDVQEAVELEANRVLAYLSMRAEGSSSGIELKGEMYQCVWLRHGRFFRVEDHLTEEGALRAFALEDETFGR